MSDIYQLATQTDAFVRILFMTFVCILAAKKMSKIRTAVTYRGGRL